MAEVDKGPLVEQTDEVLTELQVLTLMYRVLNRMDDTMERIQQQLAMINEGENLTEGERHY